MVVMRRSYPFGSRTRSQVLLSLRLLEESYARELARILGASLSGVQRGLASLERDALVSGRLVGRTRVYRLNPRGFARRELARYLDRLLDDETELRSHAAKLRRRPRRSGKPQ
jgi:DNA-binding transcriptional ArsR family regulator